MKQLINGIGVALAICVCVVVVAGLFHAAGFWILFSWVGGG